MFQGLPGPPYPTKINLSVCMWHFNGFSIKCRNKESCLQFFIPVCLVNAFLFHKIISQNKLQNSSATVFDRTKEADHISPIITTPQINK